MADQKKGLNPTAIILTALIIVLLGLGVFAYMKMKEKGKIDEIQPPEEPEKNSGGEINNINIPSGEAEPPQQQGNGTNNQGDPKLYFTDEGLGLAAINKRVSQLYKDRQRLAEVANNSAINTSPLNGVVNVQGWQNLLNRKFGSAYEFVPPPKQHNSKVEQILKRASSIDPTFEKRHQSIGKERAIQDLSNFADFSEIGGASLFDEQTKMDIENTTMFGDSGKGDKNKSERYDQFENDLKTVAENWLKIQSDMEAALKVKAIQDLRNSGWKFVGFDAP